MQEKKSRLGLGMQEAAKKLEERITEGRANDIRMVSSPKYLNFEMVGISVIAICTLLHNKIETFVSQKYSNIITVGIFFWFRQRGIGDRLESLSETLYLLSRLRKSPLVTT